MSNGAEFWDKRAAQYRARPIDDQDAYEHTLGRIAQHLKTSHRVLELGCGTGGTALRLAPFAQHITATDFADGMIAQALARPQVENVTFQVADISAEQFQPGVADVVMAFNLLHLVPDAARFVQHAHQLLPKQGLFISKTPCMSDPSASLKWRLIIKALPLMQMLGKAPPVRFLEIAELDSMIEAAGFEILETGNHPAQPPSHFVVARKL